MEREEAVELQAMKCLGSGFDLTNDFRLKFAKGHPGRRLVELDEANTRDIVIPGSGNIIRGVSKDIGCDKGDRIRFCSDVLEFNQMSELLNQKSSVQGKVPSGYFNTLFGLTGVWFNDVKDTKALAFDGYFISLYNLHLKAYPLVLRDEVKKEVPSKWDPIALCRFIRTFGTHVIVEMAIGGQDVICVRQSHSSTMSANELKLNLEDLGDFLFQDGRNQSPLHRKNRERNNKVPEVFTRVWQSNNLPLSTNTESSIKEGLAIICSKRGGDAFMSDHSSWLQSVTNNPEAILFKFVPITSLLTGIQGSGYLSHAINLYLRYKPDLEDLQYFLEFQVPSLWAPMFNELALGPQGRRTTYPQLKLRCMGPKLYINTDQVLSDEKPVTGMRLYLEGRNCNRLAIHVQHLSSLPSMIKSAGPALMSEWKGSEDSDSSYLEPIQWKRYSSVCTATVKHNPEWLQRVPNGVFVVSGVQLVAKGKWSKKALHLRLKFTHIPNCTIRKTEWAYAPASQKGSFLTTLSTTLSTPFLQRDQQQPPKHEPTALNSGVYPNGPPVPVQSRKLLKFVDMVEIVRGPHNVPGHWLVIAAKLVKEGGKIGLHVKFALLNYLEEADTLD